MIRLLLSIERAIASISRVMSRIVAVVAMLMMLVIVADVILRFSLNRPIKGAHELLEFMMLAVVLAVPYAQYKKANISMGFVVDKLPEQSKVRAIIISLACILSLGIIGILAWQALCHFGYLWETEQGTPVLNLPLAPFQFILTVGLLMLCIVLIFDVLHSVSKKVRQ